MRALVTGAEGFVGSHLLERLLALAHEPTAAVFRADQVGNLSAVPGDYPVRACDLRDFSQACELIESARADVVFHLAAIAFVPQAQADHKLVLETNVLGTLNMLEAIRRLKHGRPRLVFVSSAEVYGIQPQTAYPLTEATPTMPANLYASTKLAAEVLVDQYGRTFDLDAVIVRPFNHVGPRQAPCFALASFARQIALIEAGRQAPVLCVGNIEARRDLLDVRDVVRAYAMLAESADPGALFNLCSGRAWRIGDLLAMLLELAQAEIKVEQDPQRMRPSDVPLMLGSAALLRERLGWEPQYDIHTTLNDILDHARSSID